MYEARIYLLQRCVL